MEKKRRMFVKAVSSVTVILLGVTGLTGCSPFGSDTKEEAIVKNNIITTFGCEPKNPLIPTNTTETCGGTPLELIFTGLISYDDEGNPVNEVAKSIETNDNITYNVILNNDWKFTNGELVNSESFVNAWNYGANTANKQETQDFFSSIKGYDEVSSDFATADLTMSGLKVIDDTHFTIELAQPSSTFIISLGHASFFPLPKAFFDNPKQFGENPISNGAYKLEQWVHDSKVALRANPDYKGKDKANNDGVDFMVYSGNANDTAFADVQSGNLDVLETTKTENYTLNKNDERIQWLVAVSPAFQGFGISGTLKHFGFDEEGLLRRRAISQSLDRQGYIDNLASGLGAVPTSFSPLNEKISGTTDLKDANEYLSYNPEKAKENWAKADKISKWNASEQFNIYYNGDSGGAEAFDAYANDITKTLGIKSAAKPTPDYKTLLQGMRADSFDGATRHGWQPDYPSIENYLKPLYVTGVSNNYWNYSNKEFDKLISEAAVAPTLEQANKLFTQAQEILIKDLPSIPTTYGYNKGAFSPKLKNIKYTWKNVTDYRNIIKE